MLYGKKLVALCTSRVYDAQVNEFIKTLNGLLADKNCILFIYSINYDMYWEDNKINAGTSVYSLIDYSITDAVIIMDEKIKSMVVSKRISSAASAHGVPVVHVDAIDGMGSGIYTNFDFRKGFEKIVRHVIEDHAVRRPHFIAGHKGNLFSEERIDIFKKVLAENNIPFSEDMISYGDFWAKPAAEATIKLIESGALPEAILCANDIMAISVCTTLSSKGIKVPDDILVTGFDGYDEIYFSIPTISSARCGSDTMAKAAFDALTDIFIHHITEGKTLVEPELVCNRSCGCPGSKIPAETAARMNAGFYRYQDDIRLMFNISELMQMSDSPKQIASYMDDYQLRDTCCIVNTSCLYRENDYFSPDRADREQSFEEDMVLLYDYPTWSYDPRPIKRSETAPNLRALTEKKYPLIFTALTYMNRPMGYLCFSYDNCEMIDYARTFHVTTALSAGLGGYIIKQHRQYLNDKVEEMYKNDFLTKLYNRNGFYAAFESLKADPSFAGKTVSVFSSDLDNLKYINDHFGHDAGDIAIKTVAEALRASCPEHSLCARFGGDEMIALVPEDCSPAEIAARLNRYLERFNKDSGLGYQVNASCGYSSSVLDESFDFDRILKLADENMYLIKRSRKRQDSDR